MNRALVVTVVHHPEDARIRKREIEALLTAGWQVTYAAPFTGYGIEQVAAPGLTTVDLPRAQGRRRLKAIRAARALLRDRAVDADVVLLHDPELLLSTRGLKLPPVVWDVHEDTAAAVGMKPWLPTWLARPAAACIRGVEKYAERRVHLMLAEEGYRSRFTGTHPVVPNTTVVPPQATPPDEPRVVYVGHLTGPRGAAELIATGALLHERTSGRIRLQLVGPADTASAALLADAPEGVEWLGFRPYGEAMAVLDGALAGLSLLHDQPNYRVSLPTKVAEYLAHGVPAITTALPAAAALVEGAAAGVVIPFQDDRADPATVVDAVLHLDAHPEERRAMGARGHAYAREHLDWTRLSKDFVDYLDSLVG
ncbi:glycosyltransferase [Nocardioides marmorisolisilvae]|uniref:glycosyltransferase n=1 Tax=Nocardioides marmorisolisilvae TaxID=1542737 RepID=UPI001613532B|nr:glycosyltransferase [Nocardioides marmorisolisilvae]